MPRSTRSPGFKYCGGCIPRPTPAGVPVLITSPGSKAILTYVAHDGWDVEDHICSIAVLPELVVHFQPHHQAAGFGYLIASGKKRAEWSKRIRALALDPLAATLDWKLRSE